MTGILKPDKQLHCIVSFLLTLVFACVIPLSCSIQLVLLIGIAKEVFDYYHPQTHTCDVWDIVADAVGAYLGAGVYILIK